MRYTYCVITEVPKPWLGEGGNLYSASFAFTSKDGKEYPGSDLYVQDNSYGGGRNDDEVDHKPHAVTHEDMRRAFPDREGHLSFMMSNFSLGEVLILNEPNGREVAGRQRAPRKWGIEYEEFTNLNKAVARAQEVLRQKELLDMRGWYLKEEGQEYITPEERTWLEQQDTGQSGDKP